MRDAALCLVTIALAALCAWLALGFASSLWARWKLGRCPSCKSWRSPRVKPGGWTMRIAECPACGARRRVRREEF